MEEDRDIREDPDLCQQVTRDFLDGIRGSGEESGHFTVGCSKRAEDGGEYPLSVTATYRRVEGGYAVEVLAPEHVRQVFFVKDDSAAAGDAVSQAPG